jgi:hypothetical protein
MGFGGGSKGKMPSQPATPAITMPPPAPSAVDPQIAIDKANAAKALVLMKGRQSTILTSDDMGNPSVKKQALLGGS